jgi:hypothetical protein
MEKKREGDREAAGEVFLASDPLYHCFFNWGRKRRAAKVALTHPYPQLITRWRVRATTAASPSPPQYQKVVI